MPLVAELLLLDEDGRGPTPIGGYHVATARRLYNELSRQLEDPNGQLRRRSAFGSLLARGSSLRLLREDLAPRVVSSSPAAPVPGPAEAARLGELRSLGRDESEEQTAQAPTCSGTASARRPTKPWAPTPQCQAQRHKVVPEIPRFPQAPRAQQPGQAGAKGLLDALFGWFPSCSSTACESLNGSGIDSCTIVFSPEEAAVPCMSMPASTVPCDPGPGVARGEAHEAGLGGWPLCLPDVHAALLAPEPRGPDAEADAFAPATLLRAHFHKAAMEVDDSELAVIFPREHGSSSCGLSRPLPTPSTASTRASYSDPPLSPATALPWMARRRLVFPRHRIVKAKLWPELEPHASAAPSWDGEDRAGPLWPHVVELSGTPVGAPGPVSLALALPSAEFASRLHEALRRGQKPAAGFSGLWHRSPTGADDSRRSVRCELRVAASIRLEQEEQRAGCEAVIRRSLCEACGVGPARLRVLSLRELSAAEVAAAADPSVGPLAAATSPPQVLPAVGRLRARRPQGASPSPLGDHLDLPPSPRAPVPPGLDSPVGLLTEALGGGSPVVE